MERYMGNVVATSNNREELLNIAKDLIKKNKEIYRLHYATVIDYLYRLNGRPATEKEKKKFEKELYEDFEGKLDEAKEKKIYTVVIDGPRRSRTTSGTLEELIDYFGYTLEKGYSWQHERGRHKINRNPKTIDSLINNLNWASDNAAANGYSDTSYYLDEDLNEEVVDKYLYVVCLDGEEVSDEFSDIDTARKFADKLWREHNYDDAFEDRISIEKVKEDENENNDYKTSFLMKEEYADRLLARFDNLEKAKKFYNSLPDSLNPRMDYFDTEEDDKVKG